MATYRSITICVGMVECVVIVTIFGNGLPSFASFLDHLEEVLGIGGIAGTTTTNANDSDWHCRIELGRRTAVFRDLGDHIG
jgi:hypothetical protein